MTDDELIAEIEARSKPIEQKSDAGLVTLTGGEWRAHQDRVALLAIVKRQQTLTREVACIWQKLAIETDESLTECVERNIDGWKQRALAAEKHEEVLHVALNYVSAIAATMCDKSRIGTWEGVGGIVRAFERILKVAGNALAEAGSDV